MTAHDEIQERLQWRTKARGAAHTARRVWPGPIGECVAAGCTDPLDFDFLADSARHRALVTAVLNYAAKEEAA